jgi:predicted  nucleic acid-binding Zn-ribbon protein
LAKSKKTKTRIQKFINYTKEAFFWPVHLVMMSIIGGLAALGVIFAPELPGLAPELITPSIILMAGGLELMLLSAISQNPRFIRAINAKYQKDIDAFQKTKTLVDYYNELTLESQQRFDKLRRRIKAVRDSFKKLNTTVPTLVNSFLNKMNAIEVSYARLLYFQDKFPELANENAIHQTVQEIDRVNQDLKNASSRLKKIKEKRLKLLEMRMENYYKVKENREVIEEQLQTIEEMVEYIKDQPMTLQNTEREDIMIDNLLFETEQTQATMEEIENLMQSEFYPGITDDFDIESFDPENPTRTKE